MLTDWPAGNIAIATKTIRDITEPLPIPRGSRVSLEDFDGLGGDCGIWFVEYDGRIFMATPDELKAVGVTYAWRF